MLASIFGASLMKQIFSALIFTLVASVAAAAHHSFSAEFDPTQPVTLTGTITKVERTNPHGWIFIDVKRPDGSVVNWAVETGAPTQMARRGVTRDTIKAGMVVEVRGYRARDGSATVNGDDIRLPDGRSIMLTDTPRQGTSN
jgi:DNA/RNA endonuclease YhcR with UshA esterase domain